MQPTDLLAHVIHTFERLGVEYAIVGSVASSFYGETRLTNDVDVIAEMTLKHLPALLRAFPAEQFYFSEEAARRAVETSAQFNIIHPESGLKLDVMIISKSAFDRMRMSRRHRVNLRNPDVSAYFAAPEDVILKKMEFYREGGSEKHLRDIASMLKLSRQEIDRQYIADWADRLGVGDVWSLFPDGRTP